MTFTSYFGISSMKLSVWRKCRNLVEGEGNYMPKTKAELFERRRFLRGMTLAAGAARFSPQFFGSTAAAIAFPAKVEAAASEAGQTARLAEYAVDLRYEEIPAEVLQRARIALPIRSGRSCLAHNFTGAR